MTLHRRFSGVTALIAVVLLLVPAMAWLQYRWVGQVSEAERERMQRTLRTAAAQFATAFDSELARVVVGLQVEGAVVRDGNWPSYAERYTTWTERTSDPRLVREVLLVDAVPDEASRRRHRAAEARDVERMVRPEQLRVRRWSSDLRTFEPAAWTDELEPFRGALAEHLGEMQMMRTQGSGRFRREGLMAFAVGDRYTLVSPVTVFDFPRNRKSPPRIDILGFTLIRLNRSYLHETMLPTLIARHFQGEDGAGEYRIAVADRRDAASVIWESEPGAAAAVGPAPDVEQPFMSARPNQVFMFARGREDPNGRDPGGTPGRTYRHLGAARSAWTSRRRRAATAVRGPRQEPGGRPVRRALAGGCGAPGRLAGGRGRGTAPAQSHAQLRHPAPADHRHRPDRGVRPARPDAGTAADGVRGGGIARAADPGLGHWYGRQQSGRRHRRQSRARAEVWRDHSGRVAAARGDGRARPATRRHCRRQRGALQDRGERRGGRAPVRRRVPAELEAWGVTLELSLPDELPPVAGDAGALQSAVRNLISNAVKYGGDARWVRLTAETRDGLKPRLPDRGERAANASHVAITVSDRGLGIAAEDRRHIFEPFYRGREAVSRQIQGSGLGLNLVARIAEAHGGAVELTSEPGHGSTFTLVLPTAAGTPAGVGLGLVPESAAK